MTRRISDILAERVIEGINAMPVLAAAREQVDWEVTPMLMPDRAGEVILAYMVAVSIPVPGSVTGDKVLYMAPLDDPDAEQAKVSALVWQLYCKCQDENDMRRVQLDVPPRAPRSRLVVP